MLVSREASERRVSTIVDPNDERALDKLLADSLREGAEPRLYLVERLVSRLRIRREV